MQFIPTTWRAYAIDADGNGVTDPFNINDAALAAANYLCVAGGDLRTDAGQRRAVFAYNHSDEYVDRCSPSPAPTPPGIPVADLPIVGNTSGAVPPPDWFRRPGRTRPGDRPPATRRRRRPSQTAAYAPSRPLRPAQRRPARRGRRRRGAAGRDAAAAPVRSAAAGRRPAAGGGRRRRRRPAASRRRLRAAPGSGAGRPRRAARAAAPPPPLPLRRCRRRTRVPGVTCNVVGDLVPASPALPLHWRRGQPLLPDLPRLPGRPGQRSVWPARADGGRRTANGSVTSRVGDGEPVEHRRAAAGPAGRRRAPPSPPARRGAAAPAAGWSPSPRSRAPRRRCPAARRS